MMQLFLSLCIIDLSRQTRGHIFSSRNIAGWIILLAAIAYAVYVFIDIDSRSHSVSDTLINFVFSGLIIAAIYSLIAYFTSRRPATNRKI
jgi:hypothetical protein